MSMSRARAQAGRGGELTRERPFLAVEAADDPAHLQQRGVRGKRTARIGVAFGRLRVEVDRALPRDVDVEILVERCVAPTCEYG